MNENFNTINNNDELDTMRLQLNELKQRLDKTSTLNEHLMQDALKGKMRGVQRTIIKVLIMGAVALPMWIFIGYWFNLPWYYITFTMAMLAASMLADYVINRMDVDTMDRNLAETARQLVKMKKYRLRQELIAIPTLLLWFGWTIWEFTHAGLDPDLAQGITYGAGLGLVIGGAIGISIFFKLQKSNDEMLRQIEDLTSDTSLQ